MSHVHPFLVGWPDLLVAATMLAAELFFLIYARYSIGKRRYAVLAFVLGCLSAGVWVTIIMGVIEYGFHP